MITKGKNLQDVQNMNRSLIIRTIQKKKQTTRAEISKETGLNKATVTNIVNDLISWGIVKETGLIAGEAGRRSIAIELAADDFNIISLWVTRHHLHTGIYDLNGEGSILKSYPIGLNRPMEELTNTICEKVEEIKKSLKDKEKKIFGLALALPGPYIREQGRIALLTGRSSWQDKDIASTLRNRLGQELYCVHDSHASAMAEWCFTENFDEKSSLFCMTVSLGVGGCQIENGKVVFGNLGTAGEIGHVSINYNGEKCECGNRGCLERYCTITSALRKAKLQMKDFPDTQCWEDMTEPDLVEAYRKGDSLARKVLNEAGYYLGCGIANIINLCNPKKIIIGDDIARLGEDFLNVVKESVRDRVLPIIYGNTEIRLSELYDSALRGACMCLMQKAVETPESYFTR